jgi:FkbM family methyltransferase
MRFRGGRTNPERSSTSARTSALPPRSSSSGFPPHAFTYQKLVANVGGEPRVTLLHAAVVAQPSAGVDLLCSDASWDSRVVPRPTGATVRVPARTLAEILNAVGVDRADILKIDVEGMEHSIFAAPGPQHSAGLLVGEVHPTEEVADPESLVHTLRRQGWRDSRPFVRSTFYLTREVFPD